MLHRGWRHLTRLVFGHDIFISYARADSTEYALDLADRLTDMDYSCFLDQLETFPDEKVPKRVLRQARRSTMFVLIASKQAARSKAITKELQAFSHNGRQLIPIDLGGFRSKSPDENPPEWSDLVKGLPETKDGPGAVECSDRVVKRIRLSFRYCRKNEQLRRATAFLFVAIACLFIGALAGGSFVRAGLERDIVDSRDTVKQEVNNVRRDSATAKTELERAIAAAHQTITQGLGGLELRFDQATEQIDTRVKGLNGQITSLDSDISASREFVGNLKQEVERTELLAGLPFYRFHGDYSEQDFGLLRIEHDDAYTSFQAIKEKNENKSDKDWESYWELKLRLLPLEAELAWAKGDAHAAYKKLEYWVQEAKQNRTYIVGVINTTKPDQLSRERMLDDAARHLRKATTATSLVGEYLRKAGAKSRTASLLPGPDRTETD